MKKSKQSIGKKAKKIKLLLLDVDGVLTDGRIILDNHGNELKAFHVRDGHGIKLAQKAGTIIAKYGIRDDEAAFIGDDIVDIPVFQRVGLAVTVADADPAVKPYVDMATGTAGGRGAVREVINIILKSQGKLRLL